MIRAVFVAALAVGVLAVSLPAIDAGRADRTAATLDATAERIDRAAGLLRDREDPTGPVLPGARRVVTLAIPSASWVDAAVAYVSIGGPPGHPTGDANVVTYRIEGREPRRIRLDGVDIRTREGPVVFRGEGRHDLVLSLVHDDGIGIVASRA